MKTAILLFSLSGIIAAAELAKQDDRYIWPMFRRADVVTLEGKEIPAEYKRTTITDAQGRVIDGEWLVIDRKSKVVKFRRKTDGQQFEIGFTNLCESDRRYSELETGEIWAPLWPVVLAPEDRRKGIKYATRYLTVNAEWVRIDREARIVHAYEDDKERRFSFDNLNPDDLAYALDPNTPTVLPPNKRRKTISYSPQKPEQQEGEWLEIDPLNRNVKFRNTQGQYSIISFDQLDTADRDFAENKDGKSWPKLKFDPEALNPQAATGGKIPQFKTAWAAMSKVYSQEEIYDHLRVRTLTSAFLYEYSAYRMNKDFESRMETYLKISEKEGLNAKNPSSKPEKNTTNLEDMMRMLAKAEPENERVSLKDAIEKSGVKIYETPTPSEEIGKPQPRPFALPVDGMMQGTFFIAQLLHVQSGKPKIPFETFFAHTKPMPVGKIVNGQKSNFLLFYREEAAIKKTFGYNTSYVPRYLPNEFILQEKLTRYLIRNKQPVLVSNDKDGYAIITGFTRAAGKEPTYDAIMLDGPVVDWDPAKLPFKIRYVESVPQSKLNIRAEFYLTEPEAN